MSAPDDEHADELLLQLELDKILMQMAEHLAVFGEVKFKFPVCCRNFERECSDGCICHKPENKRCPLVDCAIPYCDGKHEVTGTHTDNPRGGFEFL